MIGICFLKVCWRGGSYPPLLKLKGRWIFSCQRKFLLTTLKPFIRLYFRLFLLCRLREAVFYSQHSDSMGPMNHPPFSQGTFILQWPLYTMQLLQVTSLVHLVHLFFFTALTAVFFPSLFLHIHLISLLLSFLSFKNL